MRLHKIKDDPQDNKQEQERLAYSFGEERDYDDSDGYPRAEILAGEDIFKTDRVYALKIINETSTRYYIKCGMHGRPYNPIGMYKDSRKVRRGGSIVQLKKTTEKKFNFYVEFLKTRNLAWLHNAEREV